MTSPHAVIDAKLSKLAESLATPPAWYADWKRLGPSASDEQRLAVYQAVRDSRGLLDQAGFYLVAWQIDLIACERDDPELRTTSARLEAVRRENGLGEDEFWFPGEAPQEYQELLAVHHAAWDNLLVRTLQKFGEYEIARLFRDDRQEFERRFEAGREYFHGPVTPLVDGEPPWLQDLLVEILARLETEGPRRTLGCRYCERAGQWDLVVFLRPVELVGGVADGAVDWPAFSLDLERLRTSFDRVDGLGWHSSELNESEGPYVWIEGLIQDQEVMLRVLALAPDDVEPEKDFGVLNN